MPFARGTFAALVVAARNRDIRRVELAWGATIAAEWGHFVALGVFAYEHGGASRVGIAGLVRLLPAAFIAPVAAVFGDRFRRERFLFAVTLLGACALAGSAVAFFLGFGGVVYGFAALVGLSSTLIRPTLQALLPSLARTPQELIAANGTTSTVESIGTLAGPLVAGVVISASTVGVAFAVWAAAVFLALGLLAAVSVEGSTPRAPGDAAPGLTHSLRAVLRVPDTRLVAGLIAAQTFVRGCLNVLLVVAAFRVFHAGAGAVGYMTAAIGLGGILGALRALTLKRRQLASRFALSLVGWGVPIALLAPHSDLVAALLLLGVVGAANSIEDVAGVTLLQRTIPEPVLAGALGLVWGLAMGGVALGSLVAPLLVHALGPRSSFLTVGAILPLLSVASYRRLSTLDRTSPPAETVELIDRISMLAPLSLVTKERLAANLTRISMGAGESVIRAGDYGDRFYILEAGTLDVEIDGRHKTMSGLDSFGEIALLRDTPRTATITTITDSQLYTLERDDFLTAVSNHRAAHTAGQAVVEARLGQPAV